MHRRRRSFWSIAVLVLTLGLGVSRAAAASTVRIIVVHGYLLPAEASFIDKQLDEAWQAGDAGAIIDLDSQSGDLDAAASVLNSLNQRSTPQFPIAVYVHDHATGPAAAVAVGSKLTVLDPGGVVGDAGSDVPKIFMKSAAGMSGRNPIIASDFVGADAPLPALNVLPGDVVTLTAQDAQKNGFADLVASGYSPILAKMGAPGASIERVQMDSWAAAAGWMCQTWVTITLIVIGILLIIAEALTLHSWGIGGAIGGLVILIILAAHVASGVGTWIGIALFFIGIGLVILDTHIVGHGLSAIVGLTCIFIGFILALGTSGGATTVGIAMLITLGLVGAFFYYLPNSAIWQRLGQHGRQLATEGYVASQDYTGYLGHYGTAATMLRPSGTGEFGGDKLPVVTEGGFIPPGTAIQVISVQGNRIVVKATE